MTDEPRPDDGAVTVSSGGDSLTLLRGGDDERGDYFEFEDHEEAERAALMVLRAVNGGSVLLEAYTTGQKRGRQYGPPDENFDAAASLWSEYLDADADGFDYAVGMILAKVARLKTGARSRDTLVDIAGYARAAAVYEGLNDE